MYLNDVPPFYPNTPQAQHLRAVCCKHMDLGVFKEYDFWVFLKHIRANERITL